MNYYAKFNFSHQFEKLRILSYFNKVHMYLPRKLPCKCQQSIIYCEEILNCFRLVIEFVFSSLTLASKPSASKVCFEIKPLVDYSDIDVQKPIYKRITGDTIWRLKASNLDPNKNYIINVETQKNTDQILSEITIFGSPRPENHKFMSSTTFHLRVVSNDLLIKIANWNSTDTLAKNYNLTIFLDTQAEKNALIKHQSVGSIFIFFIPIFLPFLCVSYFCPEPSVSRNKGNRSCCEKLKNYWLPLAVFSVTLIAVISYTMITFHLVENGFKTEKCRQNFKCFEEKVYLYRGIALPVNKIWSSCYFIAIGLGIFLTANFRLSRSGNLSCLPSVPIAANWNYHFSAFGGLMVSFFIFHSLFQYQCQAMCLKVS